MQNPHELGVPHNSWRPHQYETYLPLNSLWCIISLAFCNGLRKSPFWCDFHGLGDVTRVAEAVEITSERGFLVYQQVLPNLGLEINEGFGHWLSGFVDGEGSFMLNPKIRRKTLWNGNEYTWREYGVLFTLGLRLDDLPTLTEIRRQLRCGHIEIMAQRGTSRPSARFRVSNCDDLFHIIVPFFERFPLRAKKRGDFEIWKEGVKIAYRSKHSRFPRNKRNQRVTRDQWEEHLDLARQIKAHRRYDASRDLIDLPLRPRERDKLERILSQESITC